MERGSRRRRTGVWTVVFLGALGYGGSVRPADAQQRAPGPAPAIVSAALKTAMADQKVVVIEFGASWCTWCRRFDAFVHAPATSSIVAARLPRSMVEAK